MTMEIALPESKTSMAQDAEWCVVRVGEQWRQIRFHDYSEIFSIPGLYEKVIYGILRCDSPRIVTDLVMEAVRDSRATPQSLRVLDLGAGNGMVGELLAEDGAEFVIGVDIIDQAAEAAERDRPGVYADYHVVDLGNLTRSERSRLAAMRINCLVCVAALGFGDIPVEAFTAAFNLVERDGWVAFNIKEEFLDRRDDSGYAQLLQLMMDEGALELCGKRRYRHRFGTDRNPIHYVALVGRKRRHVGRDRAQVAHAEPV